VLDDDGEARNRHGDDRKLHGSADEIGRGVRTSASCSACRGEAQDDAEHDEAVGLSANMGYEGHDPKRRNDGARGPPCVDELHASDRTRGLHAEEDVK
jgi:hypothetical protein